MNRDQLVETAHQIVAGGKGILAADEGPPAMKLRFDVIGVESTPESRRDYRELLFRAQDTLRSAISGVILEDETISQAASDGTPLIKLVEAAGAIPGIKVDRGLVPLAFCPGERVTEGLDGLRERLERYRGLGARFAKWRAAISVDATLPSRTAVTAAAQGLARYAALCQEAGIVPIVEPEVLMDGAHDAERCAEVSEGVLRTVYAALAEHKVFLEGTLLKPNMIVPGSASPHQLPVEEVAERTIAVLKRAVPAAVPGITYLSGGQSDIAATAHLDAMNRIGGFPWHMTFSYGRALQDAARKAWSGKAENGAATQRAFGHRAQMNALAAKGLWQETLEAAA
jgi:fructose-bisphosphate aldolase, class I